MLVVAAKAGLGTNRGAELPPRVATIPFSSERQYMAALHRDTTQQPPGHVVLVKGAVERMLDLCGGQMDADGTVGSLDRDGVQHRAGLIGDFTAEGETTHSLTAERAYVVTPHTSKSLTTIHCGVA